MSELIAESYLTCTEGGSNKQYLVRLLERDGVFEVPCLYGAIGSKTASTTKYAGADRSKAQPRQKSVIFDM